MIKRIVLSIMGWIGGWFIVIAIIAFVIAVLFGGAKVSDSASKCRADGNVWIGGHVHMCIKGEVVEYEQPTRNK